MPLKKILVVKLRSLGDTILWTASLRKLREAYPRAEIHAVVPEAWFPLMQMVPGVDRWIPHRVHSEKTARARSILNLIFKLRSEKYDAFIGFHASPSVAMLGLSTGAPNRAIHFHGMRDKNKHSTLQIPGKCEVKPIIERDLDCLRAFGVEVPPCTHFPRFSIPEQWRSMYPLTNGMDSVPILWIALGASRQTKHWDVSRFAEVARKWIQGGQGRVMVSRGPGEELLEKEWETFPFTTEERSKVEWVRSPELPKLATWMSNAKVFLGNDSGPKHLAVALSIPTVTIFGPEDPFEWHPYTESRHGIVYVKNLECRRDAAPGKPPWCGLHTCETEKHRCMTLIQSDQVYQEVLARS